MVLLTMLKNSMVYLLCTGTSIKYPIGLVSRCYKMTMSYKASINYLCYKCWEGVYMT